MQRLEKLKKEIHALEGLSSASSLVLPFGISAMDDHLPQGGLALGALHEVAGGDNGAVHAAAATLFAAGILARMNGQVIWCLKQQDLFAPALALAGLNLERVIFVEAGDDKRLLACFEESLRHGSVSGVVCEVSKMPLVASRRLQLAAEQTGAIGIAIRRWRNPKQANEWEATAARTRWRITAMPSVPLPVQGIGRAQWHIELLRCRSGESATFNVEACDEKGHIALSSDIIDRSLQTQNESGATAGRAVHLNWPCRAETHGSSGRH